MAFVRQKPYEYHGPSYYIDFERIYWIPFGFNDRCRAPQNQRISFYNQRGGANALRGAGLEGLGSVAAFAADAAHRATNERSPGADEPGPSRVNTAF
jgi:hypothetical protein